ncbi:hypothetical protein THRCLA_21606, partial [Thraustotheca clavata]
MFFSSCTHGLDAVVKPATKRWRWFSFSKKPVSKCTCRTVSTIASTKRFRVNIAPVTVLLPSKYLLERRKLSYVGGNLVPYCPKQVNAWKDMRYAFTRFAPIEEEMLLCEHCL